MAADELPDTFAINQAFTKAAKWVHTNKGFTTNMLKDSPIRALIDETARFLSKGIDKGIAQAEPSAELVASLKESAGIFSGFKTFHEMNEAAGMLIDETGQLKPFKQFVNDVQTINKDYNSNYLRAEYEFTISSSEMAARWEELEEGEDRYNLQYRTVGDEKVRNEHRELDGITLPASNPFWNSYYPPNGWRCRCTVVKVRKSKYAETDSKEAIRKGSDATAGKHQEMFRFNPGKKRAAYPAYNTYTISKCNTCSKDGFKLARIPNNELCQACRVIREMQQNKTALKSQRTTIREWAKENLIGETIQVDDIKKTVAFTVSGIKEALNQPHKFIKEKNEAVKDIRRLLKSATYVRTDADSKGREFMYHYLKTTIHAEDSYIVVRENTRTGLVDFYSIVEKIKEQ